MGATTQFYSSLYSASRFVRLGNDVTAEEIQDRQEQLAAEFRRSWKSNPESVVQEVALCNTWRAQFASRIVTLNEASTPGDLVRVVGTPPKRASIEQVTKWRPLVSQAFETWLVKVNPEQLRKEQLP
jgi:CelD/BcsL family acetyltransferase involved in cellulose biosynthesis